jgi:hypothetical protein
MKYPALGHRTAIHVKHSRNALERKVRHIGLGRHGIEQEPQRRFGILAIDAAVLLVTDPAAVIHHAEQHQGRRAAPRLDPERRFNLLEIGGGHVELPAGVAEFGLKTNRWRLANQAGLIQVPAAQVNVNGGLMEDTARNPNQAMWGFDAVVLQELDGAAGGEVTALLVSGPEFQGGDQLTVTFQFRRRQDPRLAAIDALGCMRSLEGMQRPVNGGGRNAIQMRDRGDLGRPLRTFRRQSIQSLPQLQERVERDQLMSRRYAWRAPGKPRLG